MLFRLSNLISWTFKICKICGLPHLVPICQTIRVQIRSWRLKLGSPDVFPRSLLGFYWISTACSPSLQWSYEAMKVACECHRAGMISCECLQRSRVRTRRWLVVGLCSFSLYIFGLSFAPCCFSRQPIGRTYVRSPTTWKLTWYWSRHTSREAQVSDEKLLFIISYN